MTQAPDIETIMQQLAVNRGRFPRQAVRAAIQQREAITPMLLAVIEAAADDPQALDEDDTAMLYLFAMYLLAQFREPAAYPLLLRFFSLPGDLSLELTGDVVTEDLGRILASVCGSDIEPIQRMIENPAINEYVRSACLRALTILVFAGRLPREQVIDYFASLFRDRLPRDGHFIWSALVSASADLYPEELLGDIERAFSDELIDLFYIRLENVHEVLTTDKERALQQAREWRGGLIEDTIAEMSGWACFRTPEPAPAPSGVIAPTRPVVKAEKIGRNDPCPCGSGKKFKKCCMR